MKIAVLILGIASLGGLMGDRVCSSGTPGNSTNAYSPTELVSVTPLPPSVDSRTWVSPTVLGLKVGESTEKDVLRLFGKPDEEYPNSDDDKVYTEGAENELVQTFRNLKIVNGAVVVILGEKTRLVKVVSVYPDGQMTLDEAIAKYGQGFFQIESWDSTCIKEGAKPGTVDMKMRYPFALIYPNQGLLIDIRNYGNGTDVGRLDYLMKCVPR